MSTEPQLMLGAPFAIISGADFHAQSLPVAIDCDCGKPFQFDALNGSVKACPHCGTRFTHVLLVCPEDDADAAQDLIEHLLESASADEIEADAREPDPPPAATEPPATL